MDQFHGHSQTSLPPSYATLEYDSAALAPQRDHPLVDPELNQDREAFEVLQCSLIYEP